MKQLTLNRFTFGVFEFGMLMLEEVEVGFLGSYHYQFFPLYMIIAFVFGGVFVGTMASLLSFGKSSRL